MGNNSTNIWCEKALSHLLIGGCPFSTIYAHCT